MILMTARLIKIGLFLLVVLAGCWKFKKKFKSESMVLLGLLIAAFAILANAVAGSVPPLRDTIIVTALGEKNEAARREEVYIEGFTVDGKDIEVSTPVEGNWYWSGNLYCWRADYDTRRPKEITNSITLEVPVGWNRTINFQAHEWRGLAHISTENASWTVDCYKPTRQTMSVELGRSNSSKLILNQIMFLVVYGTVLLLFSTAVLFTTEKVHKEPEWLSRIVRKHWDTVVLIILAAGTLWLLWRLEPAQEFFNGDHLISLGFISHATKLSEVLNYHVEAIDVEPPLYAVISYFYYKIAPFGTGWLTLLPNISVCFTVFLTGKLVSQYTNKVTGVIGALLLMSSATVLQFGEEIRNYSYIMPLVVILVFSYCRIRLKGDTWKNRILFALSMAVVAYCNYHAISLLLGIFLLDIIWHRKGFKLNLLLPYVIAGVCYLPWLIAVTLHLQSRLNGGLAPERFNKLNLDFIQTLLYRLGGQNAFLTVIFVLSVAFLAYKVISKKAGEKHVLFSALSAYLIFFFCIIMLGRAIFYPDNTMLLYRYFAPIFPLAALVECSLFYSLGQKLLRWGSTSEGGEGKWCLIALAAVLTVGSVYTVSSGTGSTWLVSPNRLISDSDVYYQTSCVFMRGSGWGQEKLWGLEYLIYQNGRRAPVNTALLWDDKIERINAYEKLYVYDSTEQERELIEEQGYQLVYREYLLSIFEKD